MDILFKNDDFVFSYRVAGILKHNGKILLQRPKNDDYAIIGGHVAAMETSMETLKREFEEELHAKIEVDNLLAIGEIYFPWGKRPCHQICLKLRLQQVDEELCKAQQEMYRERALQKRTCKTAEDLEFFEASEDDYRERLEQIKHQKKDNRKKLKAVERCLERDGSLAEAELEYRIPVGDMVDMAEVEKDEVPGNPYRGRRMWK